MTQPAVATASLQAMLEDRPRRLRVPSMRGLLPRSRASRIALSLALQGGGAHGAFTWGVLDRLLEEETIDIAAVSVPRPTVR